MKLSIFNLHRSADPEETGAKPPPTAAEGFKTADPLDMDALRERALGRLLAVAAFLGGAAFLANLPLWIHTGKTPAILSGAILSAGLFFAAFYRKLVYPVRLGLLLGSLFLTGVSVLAADGLYGSGPVFLLALSFIAAIFTRRSGRVLWLSAGVGVLSLTGLAMLAGWIPAPLPPVETGATGLYAWIAAAANFILLASVGTISLGFMLQTVESGLGRLHTLTGKLDLERGKLEASVSAHTHDLERRLVQIRTAAEVSRAINRVMDIERLLPQVCELMRERFNLYYVGIFLVEPGLPSDDSTSYAVLRAGSGEPGRQMLETHHRLAVGGASMIGWATEYQQARIALDVGAEAVRFNNPFLPRTRSELALPILASTSEHGPASIYGAAKIDPPGGETRVLGAMSIQSTQEAAFDQDDILALQSIADSLGAAIENAHLFAAMQASLDEVERLHRQYLQGAWSRTGALQDLSYTFNQGDDAAPGSKPFSVEAPLRLRGQEIGSLVLERGPNDDSQWKPEELALAQTIADQAALALENARLLEETQRSAEEQRKAAGIAGQLWASSDVEAILRATLRELGSALGVRDGWITLNPSQPQSPDHPTGSPPEARELSDVRS